MSAASFSLVLLTTLGKPMHSQSALTEYLSPNLAPFLLLDPVELSIMHDFGTDKGWEGVQYPENLADIIYGWPLE